MRSDKLVVKSGCLQELLAASRPFVRRTTLPDRGLPEVREAVGMEPRQRDLAIILALWGIGPMTDKQIQIAAGFPLQHDSYCQRLLTRLSQRHFIDRLPRASVNQPYVYLLSRNSVAGNRLVRQVVGEQRFRSRPHRLGLLDHLLGINDVRVRAERGCRELNWRLKLWQRSDELSTQLAPSRLIPDAYFQIERPVGDAAKTSGFFLELERTIRSSRVLGSKLARYARFYYSGRYSEHFGIRALRLLVVFCSQAGVTPEQRIARAMEQSRRLGVTLAHFASLDELRSASPQDLLTAPLWHKPDRERPVPLFELTSCS